MDKNDLIIVDDHQLFRKGLIALVEEYAFIGKIFEASDGAEFLEIIKIVKEALVLMDINMPVMNGIEATKRAMELVPDLKIIALSMYGDEEYYTQMLAAGIKGFLLKDCDSHELESALQTVAEGRTFFSQDLLTNIITRLKDKNSVKSLGNENLTSREIEILRLLCRSLSSQEIADKLFISRRTVERHRANLLEKTNSKNSIDLVIYALKRGYIHID